LVEKELNALTRDYEAAKDKYEETWNELMTAQMAQKMEGEHRGKRFIIDSPAAFPTKPYKPNRLAIILVGFLIALGTSTMFIAFQESMDNTIKSADELRQITEVPVLTSISYITTTREKRIRRLKKITWLLLIIIGVGSCLYLVNQYFIKLNHLWRIILERIQMIA
jgi:hypothetical protein